MECQSLSRPDGEAMQWYNLLSDYFGLKLDSEAVTRWFTEVQQKYSKINNARLCRAVRWASDSKNVQRDSRMGKPTVAELIKWIAASWSDDFRQQAEMEGVRCTACNATGWVPWIKRFDCKIPYPLQESVVIPCACDTGRARLAKNYPECNAEKQLAVARQAVSQRLTFLHQIVKIENERQVPIQTHVLTRDVGKEREIEAIAPRFEALQQVPVVAPETNEQNEEEVPW